MKSFLDDSEVKPNSGWRKTEHDIRENRFLGNRFRENQSRPGVRAFAAWQRISASASASGLCALNPDPMRVCFDMRLSTLAGFVVHTSCRGHQNGHQNG